MDESIAERTQEQKCTVNKELIPTKVVAFLLCGAHSAFNPFLALHMRLIGLTSSETGVIGSVLPFIGCVTSPLFGAMADKYQKHKAASIFCVIFTGAFFLCLLSVPPNTVETPQLVCTEQQSEKTSNQSTSQFSTDSYNISQSCKRNELTCLQRSSDSYTIPNKTICNCLEKARSKTSRGSGGIFHIKQAVIDETLSRCVCDMGDISKTTFNKLNRSLSPENTNYFQLCTENTSVTCFCRTVLRPAAPPFTKTFALFFIFYALGSMTVVPFYSLYDTMVYSILGEDWTQWGRQRTWGGLGNMIAGLGTSVLLDALYKDYSQIDYATCFYIFAAGMLLIAITLCFFRLPGDLTAPPSVIRGSLPLFKSFASVSLFINVTIFGIYLGAASTFMYWHVMEKAQVSANRSVKQMIVGLTVSLDGAFEIPIFFFSGRFISKVGHIPALGCVSIAYAVRFVSYSLIVNPWYIILTAPLNAISFGLTEAIMTSYANLLAPPGLGGLSQAIVTSLHEGFGCGFGALITGFMFTAIGGDWAFRAYACSSIALMLPFLAFQWFVIHGHITVAGSVND